MVMHADTKRRLTGMALVAGGTFLVSPDALCVVVVSREETPGAILFYKYLASALVQWLFCVFYLGGPKKTWAHMQDGGRWAMAGSLIMAQTQVCLSLSFMYTTSANALILFSMHTVWAAIGGWLFLSDRLPPRTLGMVAVGVASAVAIFVWGKEGHGEISVLGDILAVAAGLGFAALLLVYRHAAKITPLGTSMMPSTCAGSTLSVFAGLAIAKGNIGLTNGVFSILLLAFDGGVLVGGAMLLYTIGPKYITAAEVALMCLLEPCLGPIWVFIALGQVPSLVSIVAGGVLVASLAAHEIVPLCLSKKVLVDREPTATTKPRPSQSREGGDVEMAQKMLSRENSDIKV